MPLIVDGIVGTTWGTYRRKVITVCGLIAAVTGAIVGVAKAAPIVEPWLFTSRGYVRSDIHHPLLARVIEIELKQVDAERKRLLRDVQKNELELQSDQAKATPQYRTLIQKEIERTKKELDSNDAEQKSLFNEKAK